jgi:hypothetical protein
MIFSLLLLSCTKVALMVNLYFSKVNLVERQDEKYWQKIGNRVFFCFSSAKTETEERFP